MAAPSLDDAGTWNLFAVHLFLFSTRRGSNSMTEEMAVIVAAARRKTLLPS
jgi:hypothetical protein